MPSTCDTRFTDACLEHAGGLPSRSFVRGIATVVALVVLVLPMGSREADGDEPASLQPGDVVLLDFAARWCGPCRAMQPIVQGIQQAGWPVRHVDVDAEHDLVRRFGVTGVPCYVLLIRGKEAGRIEGATTQQQLESMLAHGVSPGAKRPPPAAAAADAPQVAGIPLPTTPAEAALAVDPPAPRRQPAAALITPVADMAAASAAATHAPASTDRSLSAAHTPWPSGTVDRSTIEARLVAATARLRVQGPDGSSRGTGTVIDCRQGEALILTCAHIFRDSAGEGRIEVDLFGSQDGRGLAGQLVVWNLDRDVALVSVFTDAAIEPIRVAGPERELTVGEPVASVGCDGGADPTVHFSHVTAVDKYLGPPNVQVAGQPVPGRSGGGLFALDGSLIGVCNAADPADGEGLFAALQSVHEQLDEAGLSFVYRAAYPSGGPAPLADVTPSMPESMPQVAFDRRDRAAAVPTSSTAAAGEALPAANAAAASDPLRSSLSPAEQALLDHIRRHDGQAEVICIVRPQGVASSSEVFVLPPAAAETANAGK